MIKKTLSVLVMLTSFSHVESMRAASSPFASTQDMARISQEIATLKNQFNTLEVAFQAILEGVEDIQRRI